MKHTSDRKTKCDQEIVIRICGSAGDGAIAAGQILNRAVASLGYHILNFDSYPAEIRGFGKSVAHTRISTKKVMTPGDSVNCIVSLNDPHSVTELGSLNANAVIVYDSKPPTFLEEDESIAGFIEPGMYGYGVPLREISSVAVGSGRSRNIVALGVLAGLFHFPQEAFHHAIKEKFAKKSDTIQSTNIKAFDLGYKWALEEIEKVDPYDFNYAVPGEREGVRIVSGNEAIAHGCIKAKLRLYAGYPITPATKIMEILAKDLPRNNGVVVQTEDEISAIGHVVGGGFAGQRSMTATSGPGLALMSETLNLAVMAEVPLVLVNSQRGGPSTGLPTKTEQSDLNIAIFGGSGDSPRPVIAPANVAECNYLTQKAFEVSEAFQTPVILLIDFFLSNRMEDVVWDENSKDSFGIFKSFVAQQGDLDYRRFLFTENGISPRAYPGMEGTFHRITGLEHNENGMPNYDPENHMRMTRKRHEKMALLEKQWVSPQVTGPEGELDWGIISWGSTIGTTAEAVGKLNEMGIKSGGYFPRLMWPIQKRYLEEFSVRCKNLMVVEMNYMGQYARLVESTIHRPVSKLSEVCVNPIAVEQIVQKIVGGQSE